MKKIVMLIVLLTFPVLSVYASDNITMGKLKQLESHAVSQEKQVNLKQTQRASIKSVLLANNTVIINYTGDIKYNILKGKKLNCHGVYVLDIINPSHVYSTKVQIFKSSQASVVTEVVTAWHSTQQDKTLYNAPFLRVSIHTKKCKSKIVKENGKLRIVFGSQKSTVNTQLQKERAILKKLKGQQSNEIKGQLQTDVGHQLGSGLPAALNAVKHCPVHHKNTSHTTPPLPAAKQPPAYKFYSAKYKVPPPPKQMSYSHHKTSTALKVLADAFAKPDVITKIAVSNTDVNRIISPEPIKDVVYSKEKGLMVHFIGKNAFIKFVIKRDIDGSFSYITQPAEIYVVTQDAVYTIIVSPQNVAGRTIRLSGGNLKKIQANNKMFAQLPYEKRIIKIIKSVYKNNIPYSWDVVHPQNPKPIVIKDFLFVTPLTLINIEGTGFSLKEYKVVSPMSMHITETDFLSKKLAKNPKAIALTGFNISKDNPVYLFIVTKGGGNEQ